MPNFLVVIIPLAALLQTALYAWKRRMGAQHEGGRSGGPDCSRITAPRVGSPDCSRITAPRVGGPDCSRATAPRVGGPDRAWATAPSFNNDHEIHGSFRSSGARRSHESSSPSASASADSDSVHGEQCQFCYENRELVQLYPCNHNICNRCVFKDMSLPKVCPICRSCIDDI